MGTTRIREATVDDAPAIGEVHVLAWQAAYRGGLMPDDYLDGLSIDERATLWADGLSRPPRPRSGRAVAEDDAGVVVGIVNFGPADGDVDGDDGQVFLLNVHPEAWGQGHGWALLAHACDQLEEAGFREAVLWVHPGNARARRFYEAAGWTCEEVTRTGDVLGVEVPEVRYRRGLGN